VRTITTMERLAFPLVLEEDVVVVDPLAILEVFTDSVMVLEDVFPPGPESPPWPCPRLSNHFAASTRYITPNKRV